MKDAVECMRCGKLVPDQTVLEMIRERGACLKCRGGFILDGFPRTVPQAEALETELVRKGIALDAVINLVLPLQEIVDRLSGRRTCGKCKAVYHVTGRPPKKQNICDVCSGELFQREDDRPESIRTRMAAYTESTAPLESFYGQRKQIVTVQASGSPEEICKRTLVALQTRRATAI
jgi:adenylate kinase